MVYAFTEGQLGKVQGLRVIKSILVLVHSQAKLPGVLRSALSHGMCIAASSS
jgi:hypothetical protein